MNNDFKSNRLSYPKREVVDLIIPYPISNNVVMDKNHQAKMADVMTCKFQSSPVKYFEGEELPYDVGHSSIAMNCIIVGSDGSWQ